MEEALAQWATLKKEKEKRARRDASRSPNPPRNPPNASAISAQNVPRAAQAEAARAAARAEAARAARAAAARLEAEEEEAARVEEEAARLEAAAGLLVHQMHHAAALDAATHSTDARLRLLPTVATHLRDAHARAPLLRRGVLGAIRRWLRGLPQSPAQPAAADNAIVRLHLMTLALAERIAPFVSAEHLRASRGLGLLLLRAARSATAGADCGPPPGCSNQESLSTNHSASPGDAGSHSQQLREGARSVLRAMPPAVLTMQF